SQTKQSTRRVAVDLKSILKQTGGVTVAVFLIQKLALSDVCLDVSWIGLARIDEQFICIFELLEISRCISHHRDRIGGSRGALGVKAQDSSGCIASLLFLPDRRKSTHPHNQRAHATLRAGGLSRALCVGRRFFVAPGLQLDFCKRALNAFGVGMTVQELPCALLSLRVLTCLGFGLNESCERLHVFRVRCNERLESGDRLFIGAALELRLSARKGILRRRTGVH